ncbi:MAG: hypothetical protein GXY77_01920 [Fibrobacter sp.]|nr:hypothetical protein [Fibrobacter sp.]
MAADSMADRYSDDNTLVTVALNGPANVYVLFDKWYDTNAVISECGSKKRCRGPW